MFNSQVAALVGVFCVLIGWVEPVTANEESTATADETVAWLKGVLSRKFKTNKEGTHQYEVQVVEIDRKTLVFRWKTRLFPQGRPQGWVVLNQEVTVPLSAIDPLTIEPDEITTEVPCAIVRFSTSRARPVIVTVPLADDITVHPGKPDYESIGAIRVSSLEWAERVSRALRHLVKLAGGEVDPF